MMFHLSWTDDEADGNSGNVMSTSNQNPLAVLSALQSVFEWRDAHS